MVATGKAQLRSPGPEGILPEDLLAAIRGLDSTPRLKILGILERDGTATFAELKDRAGMNQGTLYRHLTALSRGGLVDQYAIEGAHGKLSSVYSATPFASEMIDALLGVFSKRVGSVAIAGALGAPATSGLVDSNAGLRAVQSPWSV